MADAISFFYQQKSFKHVKADDDFLESAGQQENVDVIYLNLCE